MIPGALRRCARHDRGQSLIEFAMVLPLLALLALGVIELSYTLLNLHIVSSLSREGSNLISRNTTLQDAVTAMRQMSTRPVDLNDGSSKIIFSVVRRMATAGTPNYNHDILYQRYEFGALGARSRLTGGSGAFGPAPDYVALNPDNDTALRVGNLPVALEPGGTLYITEVFVRHTPLTPLDRLGLPPPDILYSIAYF